MALPESGLTVCPTVSIDNFEDLAKKFYQQFHQQKRHNKDITEILDIRRRDNESVADFITWSNKESLEYGGATEDLMIAGFVNGPARMPRTMEHLMDIAKVYIQAEKSVAMSRS